MKTRTGPDLAWPRAAHCALAVAFLFSLGCGVGSPRPILPGEATARVRALRSQAERGNSLAQAQLAVLHLEGRGVARDPEEALRWFHAAADRGCAASQIHLGLLHLEGRHVPQDLDLATGWFRLAADQGRAATWSRLLHVHAEGALPLRVVVAFEWMRLGAEQLTPSPP